MTRSETLRSRVKSTTGGALLAFGTLLILFYLNSLALQVQPLFSTPLADTLDSCARAGVTFLHALQAIFFDRGALFSIAWNILVLFSAFAITLIGIALRNTPNRRSRPDRRTSPAAQGGQ
jgi:hypothetical protein